MNCQYHPEVPATAYCRACGAALCAECRRDAFGTVYCPDHMPASSAPESPYTAAGPAPGMEPPHMQPGPTPPATVSPALAMMLGTIPGVGAIYNGQYAKGLVHAVICGLLISMTSSRAVDAIGLQPLFGLLITVWWAYMMFEAYHTARLRNLGQPVDEYSSLIDLRSKTSLPLAGVALVLLGTLLLLHTLGVLDFEFVARFWPVLLIAGGAWMLVSRFTKKDGETTGGAQ